MSDFRDRYGRFALVAGASVGLGAAFARALAARKLDLVLLARRSEPLESLAAELRAKSNVEVRTAAIDLADPALIERVQTITEGLEVGLLVYNAANSPIGPFLEQTPEALERTIAVNCRAPVLLAHALGRPMAARGRGGIVLMTSLAGSIGTPLVATYAATKAFNLVLAEGLWDELGRSGVDVLACRAGATRTPGYEASRPSVERRLMEPEPVVEEALRALGRAPSRVPGLANRAIAILLERLLPRRLALRTMSRATRAMYERNN